MILGIIEELPAHKLSQVLHRDLGLLVKTAAHHLKTEFFLFGPFFRFFNLSVSVIVQLLRHPDKVSLSEGRLRMVVAKFNKPEFDLPLHLFRIRKTPTSFGNLARLSCFRVRHVIAGTAAAEPGDVPVAPWPPFIDPLVAAEFFGWMRERQGRIPFSEALLLRRVVVLAVLGLKLAPFLDNFFRARLWLPPDRLFFAKRVGLRA